jgi:hypothetical protein
MPWVIEESDDCGVRWQRAELTYCYLHPRVALVEALAIIEDEWRPPRCALHELTNALTEESAAHFWDMAIRIVRTRQWPSTGLAGANTQ